MSPYRGLSVLLIENDPVFAKLVRAMLRDVPGGSISVEHESTLTAGRSRATTGGFDAVLLDLGLDDSQGLATFEAMHAAVPAKAIVVLSGNEDQNAALAAVRGGAQDYLVKGNLTGIAIARALRHAVERKQIETERDRLIVELKTALANVKTLSGLLPICAWCKKVRDDQGYWKAVEVFVRDHTNAEFSHGLCPDCLPKMFPMVEIAPNND